jgi:transketolase
MELMRDRFGHVTSELLESEPNAAVVLADIGVNALYRAAQRHPDRVINVGIREQAMIGVAAGMALAGFRPIVHSYTPFLVERPFEQIKLDLGHNGLDAVLVSIGGSYDASSEGRTHQAPEDVALIGSLPGWTVHVPGHPDEVEAILRRAVTSGGSAYVRLANQSNAVAHRTKPGRLLPIRHSPWASATVVAVGPMLDAVLAATSDLAVNVLYATSVVPFDAATLRAVVTSAAGSPEIVVVEPYLAGTSAAAVSDAVRARPHRLLSLGVPRAEHRHYGTPEEHQSAHGLDAAGIRRSIVAFLDERIG